MLNRKSGESLDINQIRCAICLAQQKVLVSRRILPHVVGATVETITLSSNARRVPFEYPQIYLNKKGKAFKARVNEGIINPI